MNMTTDSVSAGGQVQPVGLAVLFRPGQGVMPPELAGREQPLRTLEQLLENLLPHRRAPAGDVVLFGPRGNGKTVLLGAFAARCRAAGAEVIETTPVTIKDEGALARWLLSEAEPTSGTTANAPPGSLRRTLRELAGKVRRVGRRMWPGRHTVGIPGFVWAHWDDLSAAQRTHTLDNLTPWLRDTCRTMPRVAILDEAHTLDGEVGRLLLNTSQMVREQEAPFLLVLAGTPNLRNHLNTMSSTFWNRCTHIGVGRLSEAATRQALVAPLQPYRVRFTEEALSQVVSESQRYPYFIQCWGAALCAVLLRAGQERDATIDAGIVARARPGFEAVRTDYYEGRYRELKKQQLLSVATAVARVFGDATTMRESVLEKEVVRVTGFSDEKVWTATETLSDLGYLWQPPGQTRLEPGIPSLMKHVLYHDDEAPDSSPVAVSATRQAPDVP